MMSVRYASDDVDALRICRCVTRLMMSMCYASDDVGVLHVCRCVTRLMMSVRYASVDALRVVLLQRDEEADSDHV